MSDKIEAQQKLCVLFNKSMTLKWHSHNPDSHHIKMNPKDTQFALDDAVAANSSCLQIKMNINSIHFKSNFAANDINHLSGEPFVAAPETPTAPAAQQSPVTPEQTHHLFERLKVLLEVALTTNVMVDNKPKTLEVPLAQKSCLLMLETDTQKDNSHV